MNTREEIYRHDWGLLVPMMLGEPKQELELPPSFPDPLRTALQFDVWKWMEFVIRRAQIEHQFRIQGWTKF